MSATPTILARLPSNLANVFAVAVVCSTASPSAAQQRNEVIESAGRLVVAGKSDEAYELLRGAAIANPRLPPPRVMLVRLYSRAGRKDPDFQKKFRALLEQAVVENPDHPIVYLELAGHALVDGRVTEAILDANKALELCAAVRWAAEKQNYRSGAWSVLATAYERRGDWAAAEGHLKRLLESAPANGNYHHRLARVYFHRNRLDEALNEFAQAAEQTPGYRPAAVEMAKLWAEKSDVAKAREWFDKAVKDNPDSFRAYSA
jgi:tetratricopeptide (TPR) repeat protein